MPNLPDRIALFFRTGIFWDRASPNFTAVLDILKGSECTKCWLLSDVVGNMSKWCFSSESQVPDCHSFILKSIHVMVDGLNKISYLGLIRGGSSGMEIRLTNDLNTQDKVLNAGIDFSDGIMFDAGDYVAVYVTLNGANFTLSWSILGNSFRSGAVFSGNNSTLNW